MASTTIAAAAAATIISITSSAPTMGKPELSTDNDGAAQPQQQQQQGSRRRRRVFARRFKTELCRNFEVTGVCEFGADCLFAHGERERREESEIARTPSGNYVASDVAVTPTIVGGMHPDKIAIFGIPIPNLPSLPRTPTHLAEPCLSHGASGIMTSLPSAHSLVTNPAGSAVDLHCDPDAVDRALTALRKFDHRSGSLALNKLWRRAGLHRPRVVQ